MKLTILLAMLLIFVGGCAVPQDLPSTVSGNDELLLTVQDLEHLGIVSKGIDCRTEQYETDERSPLAQYSFCDFTMGNVNDTEVVLEVHKFTNKDDRDGFYQYSSLHLRGLQGLISENDFGELSRFYVNNESTVYYYHLWIGKEDYLIHLTSKGSELAEEYIAGMGRRILSKFE